MQCREDPVGAFGIGLAPRIGAEMHRRPVRVPHFQPIIGAEHRDGDIGLLARDEILDRPEPLALLVDERRPGMGTIEDTVALVFDQHPLQPAGETRRLAVAEDDDRQLVRVLLGRCDTRNASEKQQDDQGQGPAPGTARPTEFSHGASPPTRQHPPPGCKY